MNTPVAARFTDNACFERRAATEGPPLQLSVTAFATLRHKGSK